jgi:hypothetical protein
MLPALLQFGGGPGGIVTSNQHHIAVFVLDERPRLRSSIGRLVFGSTSITRPTPSPSVTNERNSR